MKFITIDPKVRRIEERDCKELKDAVDAMALGAVDHGILTQGLGGLHYLAYVVAEYGMFVPHDHQHFWCAGKTLVAGAAVLYGVDETGATINVTLEMIKPIRPVIRWFTNSTEVEQCISLGYINRPRMTRGTQVLWEWPQPKPKGLFT